MPETEAEQIERRRADAIALLDDLGSGYATVVKHYGSMNDETDPLAVQAAAAGLMVRPDIDPEGDPQEQERQWQEIVGPRFRVHDATDDPCYIRWSQNGDDGAQVVDVVQRAATRLAELCEYSPELRPEDRHALRHLNEAIAWLQDRADPVPPQQHGG